MGRNEHDLVKWIASHKPFDTYDENDEIERETINEIIRHFNVIIREAKYANAQSHNTI